jgi:ribulose-phosphate 3-epimerase
MSRHIRLIPAILTDDPAALETMIRLAETFTDYVQIDVMDGQFWEDMDNISTKINWEVHLMVLHPEEYLRNFQKAGAQKAIFHHEASESPREVISEARNLGLEVGLAVNPETTISAILPLIDEMDSVLFLTVNPGFYGSKFIPKVMEKVTELRRIRPDIEIGIDGGIKESNIVQIAQLGVDVIYAGSAILLQPEPAESYRHLLALARES